MNIFLFNQVVGNTTSGCYSPATGKGLVFAYIPRILDTPGLEVHVELMGNMHNAKVLERPPVLTQPMREKAKAKEKTGCHCAIKNHAQNVHFIILLISQS